jgi:glycosyltransferase involved in cell wall biosynthesis
MKFGASIILATYCPNTERYMLCEKSLCQIHRTSGLERDQYELIVINNGGTHNHLLQDMDADLIITNSKNIGQAAALNQGASVARSDNLAFIDDDLSFEQNWLQVGIKMLNCYQHYVVSLRNVPGRYTIGMTGRGHKEARSVGGNWIMRKWLYEKVGKFGVGYYDFGGLWTRNLIRCGHKFVVSKKPYIIHMGRGHSIVGKSYRKYGQTMKQQVSRAHD